MKNGVYKSYNYNNLTWLVMTDNGVSRLKADFTKKNITKPEVEVTQGKRNMYIGVIGLILLFLITNF